MNGAKGLAREEAAEALAARVRPADLARDRRLPVLPALAGLLPGGGLQRGTTVSVGAAAGVTGATSLALALAAGPSQAGSWVAAVGLGSLGLMAGAGMGVALERLVLVSDPRDRPGWAPVVAALVDGFDVVLVASGSSGRPAGGGVAGAGGRGGAAGLGDPGGAGAAVGGPRGRGVDADGAGAAGGPRGGVAGGMGARGGGLGRGAGAGDAAGFGGQSGVGAGGSRGEAGSGDRGGVGAGGPLVGAAGSGDRGGVGAGGVGVAGGPRVGAAGSGDPGGVGTGGAGVSGPGVWDGVGAVGLGAEVGFGFGGGAAGGGRRSRVRPGDARRLVARVRERGAVLVVVGDDLPGERSHVRLTVTAAAWEGLETGAGHLQGRRVVVESGGRGESARSRRSELWLPAGDGRLAAVEPLAETIPLHPRARGA